MKIFDPKLTGSIEIQNTITGNVTIAGGLTVEGSLGGGVTGSATASYVEYSNIANKPTLLSGSSQIASEISGSFNITSESLATRIASQENFSSSLDNTFATDAQVSTAVSALNAATSSYLQNTTDTLTGDLTVTGTLTAQDLHVQEVTSSIVFSSGSNKFGENVSDTQKFTGSLQVSGSINLQAGDATFAGSVTSPNFIVSDGTNNYIQFDLNGKNSHFTNQSKSFIFSGQGASGDYLAGTLNFQSRSSVDRDINFITGATPAKRLTISGTGNVGIGTTSPSAKLEVAKGSEGDYLIVGGDDASNGRALIFSSSTNISNGALHTIKAQSGNGAIAFATGTTERMRIDSSGTIIGTGTYSAGSSIKIFEAQRSGGAVAGDWSYDDATTDMSLGTSTGHSFSLKTNNTRALTIDSSQNAAFAGDVGIGQTSLSSTRKLHIAGSQSYDTASGGNGTGGIYIKGGTTGDNNYSSGIGFSIATGTSGISGIQTGGSDADRMGLAFFTHGSGTGTAASSEAMRIEADGNVGIGTTNPVAKFEVTDGSSSITLQEYSSGAAIFLDGVNGDFTGGDYFHILADSNSYLGLGGYGGGSTPLNISNAGNVGIGTTSPARPLHVNGISTVARFQGSQTGYTQGSIVLHSGTADSPSARGQGTYRYNEGSDICWYTGTAYSDTNKYIWARRTGITAFATDAGEGTAQTSYALMTLVGSSGNVGIGTTNPQYAKLHVNDSIRIDDDAAGAGSDTHLSGPNLYLGSTNGGATFQYNASYGLDLWQYSTGGSWNQTVRFTRDGNVGIGTTSPSSKLHVNGTIAKGGTYPIYEYSKAYANLGTGGNDVAGLTSSTNGQSAMFIFQGQGGSNADFHIVYHCTNQSGNWYWNKRTVYSNNNIDVSATTSGSSTITFTFKSTSGTLSYTPLIMIRCMGTAINTSYFN